jgi:hypothetical protein
VLLCLLDGRQCSRLKVDVLKERKRAHRGVGEGRITQEGCDLQLSYLSLHVFMYFILWLCESHLVLKLQTYIYEIVSLKEDD